MYMKWESVYACIQVQKVSFVRCGTQISTQFAPWLGNPQVAEKAPGVAHCNGIVWLMII